MGKDTRLFKKEKVIPCSKIKGKVDNAQKSGDGNAYVNNLAELSIKVFGKLKSEEDKKKDLKRKMN